MTEAREKSKVHKLSIKGGRSYFPDLEIAKKLTVQ